MDKSGNHVGMDVCMGNVESTEEDAGEEAVGGLVGKGGRRRRVQQEI